jgi:2-dehydro-3-deoxygluconokinase
MAFDLVALGEVMLRLSASPPERLEQAVALNVQIGGSEANVAAACARLGLRTALISALPAAHPWADRAVRELGGHGVDCAGVVRPDGARMGLYSSTRRPRVPSAFYIGAIPRRAGSPPATSTDGPPDARRPPRASRRRWR